MDNHPFGLSDGDFWGNSEDALMGFRRARMQQGKDEILIDGPGKVSLDMRWTAPVIAYYGGSLRTIMANKFKDCAVLTAVRVETGTVYSQRAVPMTGGMGSPPDEDDPGDVRTSEMYDLELRDCLKIPWESGTYLVTLLLRNFISNRLQVRLEKSQLAYRDPEVEKYLASRLKQPQPLPVWPPPAVWPALPAFELPYYRRLPESPEVPSQPGLALTIDRIVSLKPGARAILRGSFRLPVAARNIIPAASHPELQYDFGYLRPTAIVPITLVIAGSDFLGPIQLNLRIPSYSEVAPSQPDQTTNGFFAIDLLQMEDMPRVPQTYFIHALSGEFLTGPVLCAFVDEAAATR